MKRVSGQLCFRVFSRVEPLTVFRSQSSDRHRSHDNGLKIPHLRTADAWHAVCSYRRMQPDSQLAKQILESKVLELTSPAGWRDSIAVRAGADPTDATQQIAEREMASRGLSRNASLMRDLRAALNRVADGTYGLCIDCEEPIAARCLAAVPWAARCLSCQESAERCGEEYEELAA